MQPLTRQAVPGPANPGCRSQSIHRCVLCADLAGVAARLIGNFTFFSLHPADPLARPPLPRPPLVPLPTAPAARRRAVPRCRGTIDPDVLTDRSTPISELQRLLQAAVDGEDYTVAAQLRDEIE